MWPVCGYSGSTLDVCLLFKNKPPISFFVTVDAPLPPLWVDKRTRQWTDWIHIQEAWISLTVYCDSPLPLISGDDEKKANCVDVPKKESQG